MLLRMIEVYLFDSFTSSLITVVMILTLPFLYWAVRSRTQNQQAEGLGTLVVSYYLRMLALLLLTHSVWLLYKSLLASRYWTKDKRFVFGLLLASSIALLLSSLSVRGLIHRFQDLRRVVARTVCGCTMAISGLVALQALTALCITGCEEDAWGSSNREFLEQAGLVALWGGLHFLARRRMVASSALP